MKQRIRTILFVLIAVFVWWGCLPGFAPAADVQQRVFPSPGIWDFTFKPGTSFISYFLKGNVHDTLGYVRELQGSARAVIDASGKMTDAEVQFKFFADVMSSDDAARDERMDRKFMEIHLYPEVSFDGSSAGTVFQPTEIATATQAHPIAFDLAGELTIHGITRPVTIPVTACFEQGLLITQGTTTLQLQDYTIKNPSLFIFRTENKVTIDFHIELQPAGSPALEEETATHES